MVLSMKVTARGRAGYVVTNTRTSALPSSFTWRVSAEEKGRIITHALKEEGPLFAWEIRDVLWEVAGVVGARPSSAKGDYHCTQIPKVMPRYGYVYWLDGQEGLVVDRLLSECGEKFKQTHWRRKLLEILKTYQHHRKGVPFLQLTRTGRRE